MIEAQKPGRPRRADGPARKKPGGLASPQSRFSITA
jgi:hypothetical protein